MPYSSPLSLFPEIASAVNTDTVFWNNLKKKILAEFQLNDEKPLLINGNHYSKDQLLHLIDALKSNNELPFHIQIWNNKKLLDFLEKGIVPEFPDGWQEIKKDEQLIQFLSPYFTEKFNEVAQDAFKKLDVTCIRLLAQNPWLTTDADSHQLFVPIQRSLYRTLKDLNQVVYQLENKLFKEKPESLSHFYDQNFITCLNHLPDSFYGQRNQLAVELINLYVHVYNILKKPFQAKNIVNNASRLKVEAYERSLLEERVIEIDKLMKGQSSNESSEGNNIWTVIKILGFVVYIVIMLTRACVRSERGSTYENNFPYNNTKVDINKLLARSPEKTNESILDGIYLKSLSSTAEFPVKSARIRPKTGEMLYQSFLDSISRQPNNTYGTIKLMVVNRSNRDAVIFVSSSHYYQIYLRAKDSLLFTKIDDFTNTRIKAYCGKKWNHTACFTSIGGRNETYCGLFSETSDPLKFPFCSFNPQSDIHNVEGYSYRAILKDTSIVQTIGPIVASTESTMQQKGKVVNW